MENDLDSLAEKDNVIAPLNALLKKSKITRSRANLNEANQKLTKIVMEN
jgi:hypothetical protein